MASPAFERRRFGGKTSKLRSKNSVLYGSFLPKKKGGQRLARERAYPLPTDLPFSGFLPAFFRNTYLLLSRGRLAGSLFRWRG